MLVEGHVAQMDKNKKRGIDRLFSPVGLIFIGLGVRFAMDLITQYLLEKKQKERRE